MRLAPIILFTYNRLNHTKKTIAALRRNKLANQSNLYIFSDGPRNQEDAERTHRVREYLKKINNFKKVRIIEREKNLGLADSIIEGVSEIINKHKKVIVLEDDVVTSPAFLIFMNKVLKKYKTQRKVGSITGFNYPYNLMNIPPNYPYDIYFSLRAGSWSWATWKDRWEKADWQVTDFNQFISNKKKIRKFNQGGDDLSKQLVLQMNEEINSWAIRWCYHLFKQKSLCIYPTSSYVDNIGFDDSGTHCGKTDKYKNHSLNHKEKINFPSKIQLNPTLIKSFKKIHRTSIKSKIEMFLKKFKE